MLNLPKFLRSFGYALTGIANLLRTEQNARVHLVAAIGMGFLAYYLHLSRLEAGLLFFAVTLVFAIEILNTAIEKLLDLLHPHSHAQVAFIKDAMAGAVLIAATISLVVGILVVYPHLVSR